MENRVAFIILVCAVSVGVFLFSNNATKKSSTAEKRVKRKCKRLNKLEKSIKELTEEVNKD